MSEGSQPRTPNRWGEGARLRQDILSAATRVLADSDREEALSLRAVASEANISAPSIYLHYKDKNELVHATVRSAFDDLVDEMRRVLAGAPAGEPVAALRAMAREYCRFALDNPRRYRLMFGTEWTESPRAVAAEHPVGAVLQVWTEAVEDCLRSGAASGPVPAARKAFLLWAGVHGTVSMWASVPATPGLDNVDEVTDDLIDTALTG